MFNHVYYILFYILLYRHILFKSCKCMTFDKLKQKKREEKKLISRNEKYKNI